MVVGDKLTFEYFNTNHRPFVGVKDFVSAIKRTLKVMTWGAHAWTASNYCLRFMVQGHHHKGHVYLAVNGSDLFDAYLTTSKGTIEHIEKDIHIEDLIDRLDKKIEYIDAYKR